MKLQNPGESWKIHRWGQKLPLSEKASGPQDILRSIVLQQGIPSGKDPFVERGRLDRPFSCPPAETVDPIASYFRNRPREKTGSSHWHGRLLQDR